MKNCIARHIVKLENDVFSNDNGGPGILEFCWQRRPSKCIKKTSWFMLYSGIHYSENFAFRNIIFVREKISMARKSARSRRAQFGFENSDSSFESCRDVVRFVQRTLAECKHFLCERRARIPENLQFFHANLPRHLRDLDDARTLFWLCTQCRLGDQLQRCCSV